MSADNGRQSSREVADEAEGTRAHLATTLEQLRTNLKPENVMDEVVSNARVGASSMADSLLDSAKRYPLPAMLVAAGSAMLLRAFGNDDTARDGTAAKRSPTLRDPAAFPPGRDAEGPFGVPPRGDASGRMLSAKAPTSSSVGGAMRSPSRYIPRAGAETRSKLSNLLEEQPLILGAIGLAIGAAIGAALPMTETEDNLMGGTAHQLRQSAQDAARQEVEGLRTAAVDVVDSVKKAVTDHA